MQEVHVAGPVSTIHVDRTLQGAERKNKDETKTVERRLQKLVKQAKQQPGTFLYTYM